MFTGIIETIGKIVELEKKGTNVNLWVESLITPELKIDQSIAHNGVCLTVVEIQDNRYKVTLIDESIRRSNFDSIQIEDYVNLERCLRIDSRLDGHIVQGHVDEVGTVKSIANKEGSYVLEIEYPSNHITVEKGSICVNGISLTVIKSEDNLFSIAIIPYTWEHTNLQQLAAGSKVNLEFDILGKYLQKMIQNQKIG